MTSNGLFRLDGMFISGSVLSDDALEKVLCEVESMVNSKPITKSSDSVNGLSPLTLKYLLMLYDGQVDSP